MYVKCLLLCLSHNKYAKKKMPISLIEREFSPGVKRMDVPGFYPLLPTKYGTLGKILIFPFFQFSHQWNQ